AEQSGLVMVRLLAALFAMYGVVFGAGLVARDRDEGTLEAELALAVPRWVHGAARWIAASALLATFFGLAVQILAAFVGLPDTAATMRHGTAATSAAAAIGIAAVGRGGLRTGFSSTLAAGMLGLG